MKRKRFTEEQIIFAGARARCEDDRSVPLDKSRGQRHRFWAGDVRASNSSERAAVTLTLLLWTISELRDNSNCQQRRLALVFEQSRLATSLFDGFLN
jgi:hypothetical protein